MGRRDNIIPVDVEKTTYALLTKEAESKGTSLRKLVNEKLLLGIEKDKMLQKYAPFLELIGEPSNVLYIKDNKKNKIVEIRINEKGKLQSTDDDPIYLQFAWALPELAKLKN